jgi:hypothetical protein
MNEWQPPAERLCKDYCRALPLGPRCPYCDAIERALGLDAMTARWRRSAAAARAALETAYSAPAGSRPPLAERVALRARAEVFEQCADDLDAATTRAGRG